jgi:hypothetical protein
VFLWVSTRAAGVSNTNDSWRMSKSSEKKLRLLPCSKWPTEFMDEQ